MDQHTFAFSRVAAWLGLALVGWVVVGFVVVIATR